MGGAVLVNFTEHYANRHFCARFDSCCLPPFSVAATGCLEFYGGEVRLDAQP